MAIEKWSKKRGNIQTNYQKIKKEKKIQWVIFGVQILLISKHNKGIRFMLCVIDVYSKYTVVVSLKDKNVETIVNTFKNKNKWNHEIKLKTRKTVGWQVSEFCSRSIREFLDNNDSEIGNVENEGSSFWFQRGTLELWRIKFTKISLLFVKMYILMNYSKLFQAIMTLFRVK